MLITPTTLTNEHGVPKGIIQIGAHYGQEYFPFKELGVNNFVMIEAVPRHCEEMKKRINDPQVKIFPTALGSITGSAIINLSDFEVPLWGLDASDSTENYKGQSSSILTPGSHISQYPHIKFNEQLKVPITTLDLLIKENEINLAQYDMLNIDVQGYELEVLKGAAETLPHIKYVYSEVNKAQVYKNCAMVADIDDLLEPYGFQRKMEHWTSDGTFGDALYVRVK